MNKQQSGLCDALAKHFGVNRKEFRAEIEQQVAERGGDSSVLDISIKDRSFRVGVSKEEIRVGLLFSFCNLAKNKVYPTLVDMFQNELVDFVVMYSGGTLLVVYKASAYDGVGGIFVRNIDASEGYVFEPASNYLNYNYRVYTE